jgi:hypothetical protein
MTVTRIQNQFNLNFLEFLDFKRHVWASGFNEINLTLLSRSHFRDIFTVVISSHRDHGDIIPRDNFYKD